jgi:hypothetical protein
MRPAPRPDIRSALALIAAIALTTLGGCGGDKGFNPIPLPKPSPYPKLITPFSVINALEIAYESRDTTELELLYDDAYQGTSSDLTDPNSTLLVFTKADEIRHLAKLKATTLFGISLQASTSLARHHDSGDPPGWTTIDNPFTSLDIGEPSVVRHVDFSAELSRFKFVPHTPDRSSITDTTWKIIRWVEVRN